MTSFKCLLGDGSDYGIHLEYSEQLLLDGLTHDIIIEVNFTGNDSVMGWISEEKKRELAKNMLKNQYGQYLMQVIEEKKEEVD